MAQIARRPKSLEVSRTLTVAEWQEIKVYLDSMAKDQKYFRLRFILALSYGTGCLLSELSSLRRSDLVSFSTAGQEKLHWEINVTGKRGQPRRIRLSRSTVSEIQSYFLQRGYRSFMDAPANAPLIAAMPEADELTQPETPLSATRIYQILKTFFAGAAASVETAQPLLAARYRRVSTYWLRHTFATHGIDDGISVETIRYLLGHRSLRRTSLYVVAKKDQSSSDGREVSSPINSM